MISRDDMIIGGIYRISSRNLSVGAWDGTGFIGIRIKFGSSFLFKEFHYDDGAPYGTVRPSELIDMVSADIEIVEMEKVEDHYITNAQLFNLLEPLTDIEEDRLDKEYNEKYGKA